MLLLSAGLGCSPAFGAVGYSHWEGYCEQGGQKVSTNSVFSTTQVQQSYPLATLTVYVTGSSPITKATLYSTITGTPLANPMTCSKTGYFSFYTYNQTLDLTFSGAGIAAPFTWGGVQGVVPPPYMTPEMFGAAGDGTTDDYLPFQAAIDAACGGSPSMPVYVGNQYLISQTLNVTNTRQNGTIIRDGCRIYGPIYGIAKTGGTILGATGTGHAIIETTGSQGAVLSLITLQSAGSASASTVALYTGVTSILTESQNVVLDSVTMSIATNPSANGGLGSIGIWNFGSEEHTYKNLFIHADRPVILTAYNNNPGTYGNSYLQSSLLSSHSLGVTAFVGECFLVGWARNYALFTTVDVNTVDMPNVYFAVENTAAGTNDVAMAVNGATNNLHWHGLVEGLATPLYVFGAVESSRIDVTVGGVANASAPFIGLDRGQGWIDNSEISFYQVPGTQLSRPLIGVNPSAPNDQILSFVSNSTIKANLAPQYLIPPENLLWNPLTSGTTIKGTNGFSYEIPKYGHERITLGPTVVKTAGGADNSGYIGQLVWPSTASSGSLGAGNVTVHVAGTVGIQAFGTTAQSATKVDLVGTFATGNTGVITSPANFFSILPQSIGANLSVASNKITGMGVISATTCPTLPSATPCTTNLIAMPLQSGANSDGTEFTGTIDIEWLGFDSRAPSLAVLTGAVSGSSYTAPAQLFSAYVGTEAGGSANNALVVNTPAPGIIGFSCAIPLRILLSHSLQAGANTLVLDGTSSVIRSKYDSTANIATAYTSHGVITVCGNNSVWQEQ